MYERQHLREIEALRPDVAAADKKHIPQKPVSAPRPAYIPPLEDFTKPPIPRPASNPQSSTPRAGPVAPPLSATASMIGPSQSHPSTFTNGTIQGPLSAGPVPGPRNTLPPQSPGAGPSSSPASQSAFTPPLLNGPPLGGRFVDGTKSTFVKPPVSASPLASAGPSKPASAGLPPVPPSQAIQPTPQMQISPLHASAPH